MLFTARASRDHCWRARRLFTYHKSNLPVLPAVLNWVSVKILSGGSVMLRKLSLFLLFSALLSISAAAQTADEIVNKNIAARGGLEKIHAIKSVRVSAKLLQGGIELPVILQRKRPDSLRMELTFQGKTIIQGYDGTTGWVISPMTGSSEPLKLTEDQVKEIASQADIDGMLVDYKTKGHSVELIGKEDLEGNQAYKLKVTKKNGNIAYVFIDAENFLEIKTTEKSKPQGTEIEIDTYQADYKPVNGIMIAHAVEGKVKGQTAFQIAVDKIEFDVPIDDAIFKLPVSAASPQKPQ
jgi:hypothetical protein